MKNLSAVLIVLPFLIAAAPHAEAGSFTRVVTTTSANQCRDFTRTTNYVNRSVSETGTACLYPDGAWHDVTSPGEPIISYENAAPVVYEQPATYYSQTRIVPVPVYYRSPRVIYRPVAYPRFDRYDRFDHGRHGGWDRGNHGGGWSVRGRF